MTGAAIYVLVDALGWEILRDRPFLDDILTERRPLRTILGYSSGAIPTLLTGRYPNEHGHWNLFFRSPETSPFRWTRPLRWLPRSVRETRVIRKAVSMVSRRLSDYTGYFTIYNLPIDRMANYDICEHSDIYQPGGLAPTRSLFDEFQASGIPYECYNYHRHTDAQILQLLPRRLRESPSQVYFAYLCDMDAYLHFNIGDARGVTARLRWYEEQLRRVYDAAVARWGEARVYLFSDHGMTPITATYDLIGDVERLGLRLGTDYLPAYDSTMARFWVFSDRAETALRELLANVRHGRLIAPREMKDLHIDFDDGRYGDFVYLMESGTLICPSDMGWVRFAGMHGFHPDEPESYGALLSTEPLPSKDADLTAVLPILRGDAERYATAGARP